MSPYGKVAQAAICATSMLAEHYDAKSPKRFNSADIAKSRKLSQAIVAKVLTTLSQSGVVHGAPGPGGGYTLARPPEQITLLDIVSPFERLEPSVSCPYGEGWCGTGAHCRRDKISEIHNLTGFSEVPSKIGVILSIAIPPKLLSSILATTMEHLSTCTLN